MYSQVMQNIWQKELLNKQIWLDLPLIDCVVLTLLPICQYESYLEIAVCRQTAIESMF